MSNSENALFSSDISSPGYIQSVASSRKKTKEDLRIDSLIPGEILENSKGMEDLLKAYYTMMNLEEFIYQETETFTDVILDNKATFRIADPRGENDKFFTDESGAGSTLTVTNAAGIISTIPLTSINVAVTNGNDLPGSLALSTSEIGKTFTVNGLSSYNTNTATLTTIVKHWVGPGPSYVMNTIEEAMDIDNNSENYLELMQKEIAAVIPRSLTVDKRNLYKNIVDFYKVRGSTDSIEIFFRLLFNDKVEVEYPYESTLIPSSGNWEVNAALPKGGQYLDNKGFLSYNIKIQDSLRYQKFAYLIRTGKNLSDWENVFDRLVHPAGFIYFGEILLLLELTKGNIGTFDIDQRSKVYSAMADIQPGVVGIEDYVLLVQAFASTFLPTTYAKIHRSASLSLTLNSSGTITSVEVADGGWGYTTPPSITITGQPIANTTVQSASLVSVLDSNGSIESVTITSGGLNYLFSFASPAANPNNGKVQGITVVGTADKNYKIAPGIVFPQPTATDAEGAPLASNEIAVATYVLNGDGEITGVNITNAGSGYTGDPRIRIASSANNEIRAKNIEPKVIVYCNHIEHMARTIVSNNYYNNKTSNFYESQKLYDFNENIEYFGDREIQSTDLGDINKYNVNSFIHLD